MTHASHLRAALELRPIAHGLAVGIAVASLRVADLGERLAVPAAQRNLRREALVTEIHEIAVKALSEGAS